MHIVNLEHLISISNVGRSILFNLQNSPIFLFLIVEFLQTESFDKSCILTGHKTSLWIIKSTEKTSGPILYYKHLSDGTLGSLFIIFFTFLFLNFNVLQYSLNIFIISFDISIFLVLHFFLLCTIFNYISANFEKKDFFWISLQYATLQARIIFLLSYMHKNTRKKRDLKIFYS